MSYPLGETSPYSGGHRYAIDLDEPLGRDIPICCPVCGGTENLEQCAMCERDFCTDGCILHCAGCGLAICDRCQRNNGVMTEGLCENCTPEGAG